MASRRSRSLVLPQLTGLRGQDTNATRHAARPAQVHYRHSGNNIFKTSSELELYQRPLRYSHMANSLFYAVQNTRFIRVKVLLDQGLNVKGLKNDAGQNLLMVCLDVEEDGRREKMFSYLIKRGADTSYIHPSTGRDVLTWAVCRSRTTQVRQLLDLTGGDLDLLHTDNQGYTALHYATLNGDIESVKAITEALQKYHISVDVYDRQGLTPYIHAMRLGYYDIGEYLVNDGFASPRQADKHTFKDANAWVEEGIRERERQSRDQNKKEKIQKKINGRLPQIIKQERSSKLNIESEHGVGIWNGLPSKKSQGLVRSKIDGGHSDQREYKENFQLKSNGLISASEGHLRMTGNTALNLIEDAARLSNATHVYEFKSSVPDTSKQNEYKNTGTNVTVLMDSLSAQNSKAFRKTAVAPPNYKIKLTVIPEIKKKEKISTLAILMGKGQTKIPAKKKDKRKEKSKKKADISNRKAKKALLPPI